MNKMSFEKALSELEETVEKLEKGDLSLDESLGLFEKGVSLAKFLRAELDKAEKKIEILLQDEGEEKKTAPFHLAGEQESTSDEDKDPDSGENDRLF